jgi:hypothetical protein
MNLFQDTPVLRKRFFRFALLPGAAVLGAAVVRYVRTDDAATLLGCAGAALLAAAWCGWYWRRLRRRARTILVQTRGLTCLSCGFSLVGLDENGYCPECGAGYYADHLSRCWSNAAGFPGPPT